MTDAPARAAAVLLRGACVLGLVAAVLTVGDTIATVLRGTATRAALERDYARGSGSTLDNAHLVVGASLAGGFVVGLVLAAAVAALALLAPTASRGVRAGFVLCTLLALPGAFGSLLSLGRAVALVAALACVLAPPATAAFRRRAAVADTGSGG